MELSGNGLDPKPTRDFPSWEQAVAWGPGRWTYGTARSFLRVSLPLWTGGPWEYSTLASPPLPPAQKPRS